MHQTTPAWIVAILCLSGTATPAVAQKEAEAIVEPSTKALRGKVLEWKSAQGRKYWYRLPKDISTKNPPDLVFMFHGTGLNHCWSFWNYPIVGDFRKRDIVISPDGLTPGGGDTFNFVQGPKDGEQIVGLIADFRKRFPIGCVYLYGHSQGAFFCYWFAGEHPELVDGFIAHAGNVLDVKHGKLAKQKVAVAILHGRADAVVPVDCAIRTEKIYREQGYEKLKLEIVDGLTEESGHWPLPFHVAKLFDWLDQVSTQSAAQSMRIVANELQRAAPDLGTIAVQVKKARALLPKADEADKKELPPQLDAVQALLDKAVELHTQALLASGEVNDPKAAFGAWAMHFATIDRAFADRPEWKKSTAKVRDLVKAHDKAADKAKKGLDKNTKETRAAALLAAEAAFLSGSFDELRTLLDQACGEAKPPDDDCGQKLGALATTRKLANDEAKKKIVEIDKPLLDELKIAVPALFAKEEPADDK